MGRFDHVLIVTDLDYTFLGKKGALVERNIEAVKRFCAEGGKFTIATGRRLFDAKRAIPDLAKLVNAPAILANGTVLYDVVADQAIHESLMDFAGTYEVVKYMRAALPHIGIRVTTEPGFLTDHITPRLSGDCPIDQPWRYRILPIEKWREEKWYKVVCRAEPEETMAFKELFLSKYGEDYNWCHSERTIFEFQRKGCHKGVYVDRLRDYYRAQGLEMKIYVCGDYENDLEMLQRADVAVCPENALDSVKTICDLCLCAHTEGTIADLIERIEKEG